MQTPNIQPVAASIDPQIITQSVAHALSEDIGPGDVTAALIPIDAHADAQVISREAAVICGRVWFDEVFQQLEPAITLDWQVNDGDAISANQLLCQLHGPARAILSGERTALNFLQSLSATATLARRYAEAVAGTNTRVLDTRKTIPGLRHAQKYAVACGGCYNHRHGLYDAILIKENHILAAGSISAAVRQALQLYPKLLLEVEVENLAQLQEAMEAGAQRVLLDNMNQTLLRQAVELARGRIELEASGGITLDNVRSIAETGVDFISVGELTKHIHAVDLSMRFQTR